MSEDIIELSCCIKKNSSHGRGFSDSPVVSFQSPKGVVSIQGRIPRVATKSLIFQSILFLNFGQILPKQRMTSDIRGDGSLIRGREDQGEIVRPIGL